MNKWLRRIRGVLGTALTWAAAWSGLAFVLSLVGFFGTPGSVQFYAVLAAFGAVVGFVGGTIFSVVLRIAERHRSFDDMSLPRFAGWGAVGGVLLAMLWVTGAGPPPTLGEILSTGVIMGLMGAGSAGGSLALARRADPLLEPGDPVGLLEGDTPDPST
jgi:uncharacterized membrane protein YjfL (UPF0719 family)